MQLLNFNNKFLQFAEYVFKMGRIPFKVLIGQHSGRRPVERLKSRLVDNMERDVRDISFEKTFTEQATNKVYEEGRCIYYTIKMI